MEGSIQRRDIKEAIRSVKVEPGRFLSEVEVPLSVYQVAKQFASSAPNSVAEENCRFKMDFIYNVLKLSIKSGKFSDAREEVEGWQVATKALLRYALNLLLAPKRTEFRRIRLSNSYYVYQVSHKLKAASQILVYMGYGAAESAAGQEPQELNYSKHDVDIERILESATDLVVLHGELELMKEFVAWAQGQNSNVFLRGIIELRRDSGMTYEELKAFLVHPEGQQQNQLLHRDVAQHVASPSGYAPHNQLPSSGSYQHYPDPRALYRHPEDSPEARYFNAAMSQVRQYPTTGYYHQQAPGPPSQRAPGPPSQRAPGPPSQRAPGSHSQRGPGSHSQRAPGPPSQRAPGSPSQRGPGSPSQQAPGPPSQQGPRSPSQQAPGPPSQYGSSAHSQHRHPADSREAHCFQQVLTEVRHHHQQHTSPPQPHRLPAPHLAATGRPRESSCLPPVRQISATHEQAQFMRLQQDVRRSSSPAIMPSGHPAPTINRASAPPFLEKKYFPEPLRAKMSDSSSVHGQFQDRPTDHRLQQKPNHLHENLHEQQRHQGGGADEPHFPRQHPGVFSTPSDRGSYEGTTSVPPQFPTGVPHGGTAMASPVPSSTGTDIAATQRPDSDSDSEPTYENVSAFMRGKNGSQLSSQLQPKKERGHKAFSPVNSFDRNIRDLYKQYPDLAPQGQEGGGGGGGDGTNYTPGPHGRSIRGFSLSSSVDASELPGPIVETVEELAVLGDSDVEMSFISDIKNVRSVSTGSSLNFSFDRESTPRRPLTPKSRQSFEDKWKVHDSIVEEAFSPSNTGTADRTGSQGHRINYQEKPAPHQQSSSCSDLGSLVIQRRRSNAVSSPSSTKVPTCEDQAPAPPLVKLPLKNQDINPVAQRHKKLISPTVDRSKVTASSPSPSPSPQHGAAKASLSEHREDHRLQDTARLSHLTSQERATGSEDIELHSKRQHAGDLTGHTREQTSLCSEPYDPSVSIALDFNVSDTWECNYCLNLVPKLYVFCDICGRTGEKDTQGVV